VRNLTLRLVKTPFCQGTILALDVPGNTVTIQHRPGTLTPLDDSYRLNPTFQCVTAYTPEGEIIRSQFLVYKESKADDLGNGRYRVHLDKQYSVRYLRPGLELVIPNRKGVAPIFAFGNTAFCSLENLHIRNSRSCAVQGWGGVWDSVDHCHVFPFDGLCLSSNADGFIAAAGLCMTNNVIENPGDDGCNAGVSGREILKTDGNTAYFPPFPGNSVPGNSLLAVSARTGQYLAMPVLKKNDMAHVGKQWVRKAEFENPLPDTIESFERSGGKVLSPVQGEQVFRGLIRYDWSQDFIYDTRQWGIGTIIRNNRFRHLRSGVNIQASCSLVENNVLENLPMGTGIAVSALTAVGEGVPPYCVTVRGNRVREAFMGIRAEQILAGSARGQCASIRGIRVEDNSIRDAVFDLFIRNVGDSVFCGNIFTGSDKKNSFGETPGRIVFERCRDIDLSGNSLNGRKLERKNCEFSACEGQTVVR
jgi:hypothetical protein